MSFFKAVEPYRRPDVMPEDAILLVVNSVMQQEREHYQSFLNATNYAQRQSELIFLQVLSSARTHLENNYNFRIDAPDLYAHALQQVVLVPTNTP